MEGGLSGNTVLPNSNDKLKVLNVKPLRMLVPQFPDSSEGHPFVCVPPNGPFPAGFSPFFPFSLPSGSESAPDLSRNGINSNAMPIRSFRTENLSPMDTHGSHQRKSAGSSSVKKKKRMDRGSKLSFAATGKYDPGISLSDRDDGNRELVENVLLRFDALRRKLSQIEDTMELPSGVIKRADLKAGNTMMSKGVRTNMKKRIGAVPGVEIGDIFFFRFELCLVGLHSQSMAGIDYMKGDLEGELVALSIVSSGGYDNDAEDPDILIYSGQGGSAGRDKEASDQKLERGNLALEKSLHRGNEIRVIRGLKDTINQSSKVYVYDGLYKIQESWMEKGKSGCNMFKYKLARIPGQTGAFSTWKSIQRRKEGVSSRVGLILSDLTSGAESIPVSLVNEVDDDNGPVYFTYFPTVKYLKSFDSVQSTLRCDCSETCQPGNANCSCIQKNGGDFPYTTNGVLVCRKPLIYECSPSCPCGRNCKNRVSQTALKFHLEVFKTRGRGWGLRSRDPIRAGSFICEYAGEVIDNKVSQAGGYGGIDDYIFYSNRRYESFKWNYEPELVGEESSDAPEDFDSPYPLSISAKNIGNVARFMNHSCTPNIFWQPIMYEHNNEACLHIGFFAKKHIPPMTELTYDYGTPHSNETESNNNTYGRKKCLCGSQKCRGYFY
ncbi:Histone-lysine N-methyltransferase, H3 lysine-9 specific SUVH3 [Hibiscus syriacus]|uniref:Histone-lysine N-methyltransferase, H3 lysine-9 specific SUVH3 n=1 Tax=Hibiscus syriacus TaxID=106335 RepID=A0A6A2WFX3_HIBSY|nr:histone-lysine N-methyltransferase, H3 lysine-9 specific SUVH1-like [Hibiscus syriacus]XP_039051635.1 histone-lysine N-methyltransferase, H3 lysine-9 specific SUVH1-like [Hibiscus syriacus]KAE8657583.1 Histone-lysine N-methyltransferase, H3 lysine-9 specific SUVH3 [Hibiscus syriacus]